MFSMRALVILFCLLWFPAFGEEGEVELSASINVVKYPDCLNGVLGELAVVATGGKPPFQYKWSNQETTNSITGLVAGRYKCIVTDSKGNEIEIIENLSDLTQSVDFELVSLTNPSCHASSDGEITVKGLNPARKYVYQWLDCCVEATNSDLPEGDYVLKISDGQCSAYMVYSLVAPAPLEVKSKVVNHCSCSYRVDGSIELEVCGGTPPYVYFWKKNGVVLEPQPTDIAHQLEAGLYSVEVTDANQCSTTLSNIEVKQVDELSIKLNYTIDVSVLYGSDGVISIEVSGGTPPYSYRWSNGADCCAVVRDLVSGCYSVNVTDAQGCTTSMSNLCVNEPSQFHSISFDYHLMEACTNATVKLDMARVNNVDSYQWICIEGDCIFSDAFSLQPNVYLKGNYDQYKIVLCGHDDPDNVLYSDTLTIAITQDISSEYDMPDCIHEGEKLKFTYEIFGGSGSYEVILAPDSLIQYHTNQEVMTKELIENTELYFQFSDLETGCQFLDTLKIEVIRTDPSSLSINAVNWLTPNSDGINDKFSIEGIDQYPDNKVHIYNRWGDLILEFINYNNLNIVWNGKNKDGILVPNGTYFYIINSPGYSSSSGWIQVVTQ